MDREQTLRKLMIYEKTKVHGERVGDRTTVALARRLWADTRKAETGLNLERMIEVYREFKETIPAEGRNVEDEVIDRLLGR